MVGTVVVVEVENGKGSNQTRSTRAFNNIGLLLGLELSPEGLN
jgi:hypothetical protein